MLVCVYTTSGGQFTHAAMLAFVAWSGTSHRRVRHGPGRLWHGRFGIQSSIELEDLTAVLSDVVESVEEGCNLLGHGARCALNEGETSHAERVGKEAGRKG